MLEGRGEDGLRRVGAEDGLHLLRRGLHLLLFAPAAGRASDGERARVSLRCLFNVEARQATERNRAHPCKPEIDL